MTIQLIMQNFCTLILKDFPLVPQLKKAKKICHQETRINRLFTEFFNFCKRLVLLTENTTASILRTLVTPYIDIGASKKEGKA